MADESTQRNLVLLLDFPSEDVGTEIKSWLDLTSAPVRANVARELLALANHGGGYILFGFDEDTSGFNPSGPCPYDLTRYSQDEINNILKRHAEPVFECIVHHLSSSAGNPHVIVEVPGGHSIPIRSCRGPQGSRLVDHTYYIRRPGPESAPPDNGREWDALIARCIENGRERLLESFRRIVSLSENTPYFIKEVVDRSAEAAENIRLWNDESFRRPNVLDADLASIYSAGSWSCSYALSPVDPAPTLPEFRRILGEVKGNETGWPPWLSLENRTGMGVYIFGELIECWLKETPDLDFWRADPKGQMFLLRRLQEDTDFQSQPSGSFIDLTLPVWRVGECLLHAQRLAERLNAEDVTMMFSWSGLEGRELRTLANPMRMLPRARVSHDDAVQSVVSVAAANIGDSLPEIVKQLVAPLYARFDFYDPDDQLYSSELHRMRTRT